MKKAVLFILLLCLSLQRELSTAKAETLRGPVIVTQLGGNAVSGGTLTFEDIGTGRVWQYQTDAFLYARNVWLPDGCKVLLYDKNHIFSLSINGFETEDFPPNTVPLWSADGQSIVFAAREGDSIRLYKTNAHWQATEIIATLSKNDWMNDFYWLSDNQFFYSLSGGRKFTWDRTTNSISRFGEHQHKLPDYGNFYITAIAPNQEIAATYADLNEYRSEGNTFVNDLTASDLATLEAQKPTMSGFDLFSLNTGTTRHIDVQGQFLLSLTWAPASNRLAMVTDYNGTDFAIYAYDLDTGVLHRIADASIYRAAILAVPAWSHDGEWLAFRSPSGVFVQQLSDGKRIQLDERMDGDATRYYWSPVMDYSKSQCS
jgi:hypothetical protein